MHILCRKLSGTLELHRSSLKKNTHENISVCILFLLIVKYNDIEKELRKQKFLQWYDKESVSISTKTLF